jgi:dihydrofolate synthase / folylpolyglutamate synthase
VSKPLTSYEDAVAFLDASINYERTTHWVYNGRWLNLERVVNMLDAIGNPQRKLRIIHVAGTKGKGTTAGAIAQCLTALGFRTGLLTSPHLITPRERVRVDGEMICREDFTRMIEGLRPHIAGRRAEESHESQRAPTYFETMTAMALGYFADRQADWAVVEVGLGGRYDSTNVVEPTCCVITSIGHDHMDKLGETPALIAAEKAGIIKLGVPVVIGAQPYLEALQTLREAVDRNGCRSIELGRDICIPQSAPLLAPVDRCDAPTGWQFTLTTPQGEYADLTTPLLGEHQLDNLATAVGAVELALGTVGALPDRIRIADALADYRCPARIEVLQRRPALVLDVAHTVESIAALTSAIETHMPGRRLHMIFGCSQDKDLGGMMELLRERCATFTAVRASIRKAMPVHHILAVAYACQVAPRGGIRAMDTPWEAVEVKLGEADPTDVVCATGSFFPAGEIRERWRELHPDLSA